WLWITPSQSPSMLAGGVTGAGAEPPLPVHASRRRRRRGRRIRSVLALPWPTPPHRWLPEASRSVPSPRPQPTAQSSTGAVPPRVTTSRLLHLNRAQEAKRDQLLIAVEFQEVLADEFDLSLPLRPWMDLGIEADL